MKRLLFYLSVVSFSILLGFILSMMKPKMIPKLLSVNTEYAWVGDGKSFGSIMLYINDLDHVLADENHYVRILIGDETKDNFLEVSLYDLELGHTEYYLSEVFSRLLYTISLPEISEDIIFDHAYLHLELMQQERLSIYLGRISLFSTHHHEDLITWTSLEGFKKPNDLRSRIAEIHVMIEGDGSTLTSIDIGTQANTTFRVDENMLIISVSDAPYLLYDVPLIFTDLDGRKQVIHSFRYITDYIILKESGPWIHTYELY